MRLSSSNRLPTIAVLLIFFLTLAILILILKPAEGQSRQNKHTSLLLDVYEQLDILSNLADQLSKEFNVEIYKQYEKEAMLFVNIEKNPKQNQTEINDKWQGCKSRVYSVVEYQRSASIQSADQISSYIQGFYPGLEQKALVEFSRLDKHWDQYFMPVHHPNASRTFVSSIFPILHPSKILSNIYSNNHSRTIFNQIVLESFSIPDNADTMRQSLQHARERLWWIAKQYSKVHFGDFLEPDQMLFNDLCLLWSKHLKQQQLWRIPIGALSSDIKKHTRYGYH